MGKIKQAAEKRARNEEYATVHRKSADSKKKRAGGIYVGWCRTKGHPPDCACNY